MIHLQNPINIKELSKELSVITDYSTNRIQQFLSDITGISLTQIISSNNLEVDNTKIRQINDAVERLKNNEPIEYITGKAYFRNLELNVNTSTLIPRPETEQIIDIFFGEIESIDKNELKVFEVGTGSGCIPISIYTEAKNTTTKEIKITTNDISKGALKIAKNNFEKYKLNNSEINFVAGDFLTDNKIRNIAINSDILISNPPYIESDEMLNLSPSVKNFEPNSALEGGQDGLEFYKSIRSLFNKNTAIKKVILEINEFLAVEILALFDEELFERKLIKDLFGSPRFVVATKK